MEQNCLRCGAPMTEHCNVDIYGGFWRLGAVSKKSGAFSLVSSPCRCAVCPRCGHVELYVAEPHKFKLQVKKDRTD